MNKWIVSFFFTLITLAGCSNDGMVGDKPPKAMIEIGTETYETTLGSYCWNGKGKSICVDTAGPIELLKGKQPINVTAGEEVKFVMNYKPQPTEVHVTQIHENEETEVIVKDNRFPAPAEKGIYYYAYSVWWMDEKEAYLSHGDAFYAFVLQVN
ncbi:hypothetical protein CU633_16555 [Bacillus sp. V3-13]|uniref:hypothetical protein n=1 Tax=Bacillus sp. V3-13 TaxID=2053728 RepID=UPI000C7865B9|nr:hypothetical protein [Bacillus sp. V3-13]PLR76304.1 hypothetical protein CU633_16555 [Bacillus sp. V3-13]